MNTINSSLNESLKAYGYDYSNRSLQKNILENNSPRQYNKQTNPRINTIKTKLNTNLESNTTNINDYFTLATNNSQTKSKKRRNNLSVDIQDSNRAKGSSKKNKLEYNYNIEEI